MKRKEMIKDAISHAKIVESLWLEGGENYEFRSSIRIYENGFEIAMWHTAASPQYQFVKPILIKGYYELGDYICGHIFETDIQHFTEDDMEMYAQLLEDLIEMEK